MKREEYRRRVEKMHEASREQQRRLANNPASIQTEDDLIARLEYLQATREGKSPEGMLYSQMMAALELYAANVLKGRH